jgi:hypothetical protein
MCVNVCALVWRAGAAKHTCSYVLTPLCLVCHAATQMRGVCRRTDSLRPSAPQGTVTGPPLPGLVHASGPMETCIGWQASLGGMTMTISLCNHHRCTNVDVKAVVSPGVLVHTADTVLGEWQVLPNPRLPTKTWMMMNQALDVMAMMMEGCATAASFNKVSAAAELQHVEETLPEIQQKAIYCSIHCVYSIK